MKNYRMFIVLLLATLTTSLTPTIANHRFVFGPAAAIADDDDAAYEADQARQRAEDAEQQERYQQEQQQQQMQEQHEQNDYQRQQEEQRHQEEMDRLNSGRQEQN